MLIAQPDNGPDTNANKLINDNLVLTVNPVWKDKGTQIGNDLKVPKSNEDPVAGTLPLPDRKPASGFNITLVTQKKTPDEKKQALISQVRSHLQAIDKQSGKSHSAQEMTDLVNSLVSGPEPFTTDQGKQGEVYVVNDITADQSNLIVALIIPGIKPGTTSYVQFNYYHYNYEIADDLMEMRVLGFADDQKEFVDFTKKIFKTLKML